MFSTVREKRKLNHKLDGWLDLKYWNSKRLLICFFAKKRATKLMLISKEPVLRSVETEEPAIYQIDQPEGKEEHIAFVCPFSPPMYAYYDTSKEKQIIVLLVNGK